MKCLKIPIGLGVAVITSIAAFATTNGYSRVTVFYIDNIGVCTPVSEPFLCVPGPNPCLGTIPGVDLGKQLYSDSICFTPLTKH
ncbi:hypothetical protein [Pedobacter sp. HMWF019]|uniref:hypothetical protein n=1 Tax=Pedobacter sp. HMWF019 TaxID=2056856 RepID=UPI0011B24DAB|nr:hypothetical protein [Pedobacter sp. HMWF019]